MQTGSNLRKIVTLTTTYVATCGYLHLQSLAYDGRPSVSNGTELQSLWPRPAILSSSRGTRGSPFALASNHLSSVAEHSNGTPRGAGSPDADKNQEPLSQDELNQIDQWSANTSGGQSQRQFVGLESTLKLILGDLNSQPASSRPYLRYLTVANLYNISGIDGIPTESDAKIETYRVAISKLLNCLSKSSRITTATAVDSARTLLRFDLRDYQMTPEVWEKIVNYYPYGIAGSSPSLEERLRALTGSRQACLRADWFLFAASQPPLYGEILHLPQNEKELESELGLDSFADLRAGRAVRAGVSLSEVSNNDRILERHQIGSYPGAFWMTYDFQGVGSRPRESPALAPIGPIEARLTQDQKLAFKQDASEILFQLPNGLVAGYLAGLDGTRLDFAPTGILQDKTHIVRNDATVVSGISCIVCHSHGFEVPSEMSLTKFVDQLRSQVLDHAGPQDRAIIQELYPKAEVIRTEIETDANRFSEAVQQAQGGYQGEDAIRALYQRYSRGIAGEEVSAEFWTDEDRLLEILDRSADPALRILGTKIKSGLPIGREGLLASFGKVVQELGLQVLPFNAAGYKEVSTAESANNSANHPDRTVIPIPGGGTLSVEMTKLVYHVGDSLGFILIPDTNCFVKIVQLSADHLTTQLVPNGLNSINQLRAGERRMFPGRSADGKKALSFTTTLPAGTEILLVLVSRSQFRDDASTPSPEAPFRLYPEKTLLSQRGVILVQAGTPQSPPIESEIAKGQVGYVLEP
jgi:hypothetical protein